MGISPDQIAIGESFPRFKGESSGVEKTSPFSAMMKFALFKVKICAGYEKVNLCKISAIFEMFIEKVKTFG